MNSNRPFAVPRGLLDQQVDAMLAYLDTIDADLRGLLFEDAIGTMLDRKETLVRLVPDTEVTSSPCSVSGAYLSDHEPPILAVALSASRRRRAFTVLHELGHHLQQSVFHLMELLMDQPDGGLALEDAACDSFASAILLPSDLVEENIGSKGPTAAAVVRLWEHSNASRAAICVRTAAALKAPGHVSLLDEDGIIIFTSSRGLPPLRRNSDQSASNIFRAFQRSSTTTTEATTTFAYRDGIRGQELYAQAADLGGLTVVVSVTERAPWLKLSLPKKESGPKGKYWVCEHDACGHEFRTFSAPCSECRAPHCPDCRRCNCGTSRPEKTCNSCYLVKAVHLFDPQSPVCQDCS